MILAKISTARFTRLVRPGEQIVYTAKIANVNETGASIEGVVTVRVRAAGGKRGKVPMGEIEMMFSHIDQNMAGLKFPDFNFVFNSQFMELFETYRREFEVKI